MVIQQSLGAAAQLHDDHAPHQPFIPAQRQLLPEPRSPGRAKQIRLREQQAILSRLWSKQIQQPLKVPGVIWHSPCHPQKWLPVPCPFGGTGIPPLEQHKPARSRERPSHNQLCAAHWVKKPKQNTTGMEEKTLGLSMLILVVFWQFTPTEILAKIVLNGSTMLKGKCGVWPHWGISFVRTKPPIADLMTWQKHCK